MNASSRPILRAAIYMVKLTFVLSMEKISLHCILFCDIKLNPAGADRHA